MVELVAEEVEREMEIDEVVRLSLTTIFVFFVLAAAEYGIAG